MKNRTMFAKPVDVSDAPQRVAGRRWEGKLALPSLIGQASTTHISASNGMQHRACKVVHTRPSSATHDSQARRSAHTHTLLAATKPCLAMKICLGEYAGPERAPVAAFSEDEMSYERPKRSDRLWTPGHVVSVSPHGNRAMCAWHDARFVRAAASWTPFLVKR
jgi:hypothetical protein